MYIPVLESIYFRDSKVGILGKAGVGRRSICRFKVI
jgi:hypothetical protein